MGTRVSFSGGKAAEAWSWSPTPGYCRGQENVDLYTHSPTRYLLYCCHPDILQFRGLCLTFRRNLLIPNLWYTFVMKMQRINSSETLIVTYGITRGHKQSKCSPYWRPESLMLSCLYFSYSGSSFLSSVHGRRIDCPMWAFFQSLSPPVSFSDICMAHNHSCIWFDAAGQRFWSTYDQRTLYHNCHNHLIFVLQNHFGATVNLILFLNCGILLYVAPNN
jgi:hypothetical protein